MAGFGGRTDKILKTATEITGIKVSRARYDKEISLPKRVRIDLEKKLIALRSRESSLWSSVDSLSSSSSQSRTPNLDGCYQGLLYPR